MRLRAGKNGFFHASNGETARVHQICKRLKHQLGNVLLINHQHDRENQQTQKFTYFSYQAKCPKMLQTPKILNRLRRLHIKHGTNWKSSPTCLSASTGRVVSGIHSCSGRFLPVQPRIWGIFCVCGKKASPPNFMQWGGRGKKRKKLTEQEMMTQLYGNHFRTRTRDSEPGRGGHMKRCRWSSARFRAVSLKRGKIRSPWWPIIWKRQAGLLRKIYFKVTVSHIQYLKTRPQIPQRHLFIHATQNTNSEVTVSLFFFYLHVASDEASRTGCVTLKRALCSSPDEELKHAGFHCDATKKVVKILVMRSGEQVTGEPMLSQQI